LLPPLTDAIEILILIEKTPLSIVFTKIFPNLDGGSKPPPYDIIVVSTLNDCIAV